MSRPATHAPRPRPVAHLVRGGTTCLAPTATAPTSTHRRLGTAGFTLVEVMLAAIVLVLGITTAITTLQSGFQAIDTARHYTLASQVMQSELERLRLKSWAQLQALQDANDTAVAVGEVAGFDRGAFSCTRTITDLKTDMKQITVVATWRGYDGRSHTARLITRYGKTGLYDYFYTSH